MALELIGKKIQMGNLFKEDGSRVPVTFVELMPLTVTQVKRADGPDGYSSVQVGWEPVQGHRLSKAERGHQASIEGKPMKRLTEFRVEDSSRFEVNQVLSWDVVKIGDRVDVVGTSKGRGFTGVVKRYHFRGAPSSHGTSMVHRKPMSSGGTDSARVFKGVRKPGHMGAARVTVKNLEVVLLNDEQGIIAIRGAIPGPNGGIVRIIPRTESRGA